MKPRQAQSWRMGLRNLTFIQPESVAADDAGPALAVAAEKEYRGQHVRAPRCNRDNPSCLWFFMHEPVGTESQLLQISHHTMLDQTASSTSGTPKMLRILAPPLAGSAGRSGDPRPDLVQHRARLSSSNRGERHMLTIYDKIQQLRAELTACIFTRSERRAARAKLEKLLAEQAAIDRKFDAMAIEKASPE